MDIGKSSAEKDETQACPCQGLALPFRFRLTFLGGADFRAIRGGAWARRFEWGIQV